MSSKSKNWLLAIGYVVFIYSTLSIVRVPVNFLRSHGLLRLTLSVFFTLISAFLLWKLVQRKNREPWRIVAFIGIGFLYFLIARYVKTPEEQIHFFEYGLVGVLFFQALRHHFESEKKTFIGAFFLTSLAGFLDEILQGMLPSRHYDPRDIALNMVSGFLGLLVYKIIISRSKSQEADTSLSKINAKS